jgi:hypothetical protein
VNPDWWFISGHYFGYPRCCIEAFCRLDHLHDSAFDKDGINKQTLASKGTGFIPCALCAERVILGEIELVDLIKDRVETGKFPRCSSRRDKRTSDKIEAWAKSLCEEIA